MEGRLEKLKNGMALLNQATLSDPNKTVADMVKETIAAVGENIKVRPGLARRAQGRAGQARARRTAAAPLRRFSCRRASKDWYRATHAPPRAFRYLA